MGSRVVVLTDDNAAIEIAPSGAPELAVSMRAWLERECKGRVRIEADSVFNVIFEFELVDDAERFRAHWAPPTSA